MFSLIICSRNADILQELKENIKNTIGVAYELIVIDNSQNQHSIFSAYNEGVKRAKYPYLCFMHEDILYRTQDWGTIIAKHFEDKTIGLLAFAGAHFLPSTPVYWSSTPFITEYNLHNDNSKIIDCFKTDFFKGKEIIDAVACDGFCFFMPKDIFGEISFDEKTYSGFHFYDMDICMEVLATQRRVVLCRDVLIEHCWSESAMQSKKGMDLFYVNQKIFFEKWKAYFPISRGIDDIPQYVIDRINKLYKVTEIRNSKAYKIGKMILNPFNKLRTKS